MDLSSISKLLPEFLEMFKGKNLGNLQNIMSSLGNTGMVEKFLGSDNKYVKYLPLLPLLGSLSKDGFKGLLNNSESLAPLLSTVAKDEKIAGMDVSTIVSLLPMLTAFLNKDKKTEPIIMNNSGEAQKQEAFKQEENPTVANKTDNNDTVNEKTVPVINPLSPISEIADRDIIYFLNRYISNY